MLDEAFDIGQRIFQEQTDLMGKWISMLLIAFVAFRQQTQLLLHCLAGIAVFLQKALMPFSLQIPFQTLSVVKEDMAVFSAAAKLYPGNFAVRKHLRQRIHQFPSRRYQIGCLTMTEHRRAMIGQKPFQLTSRPCH